MSQRDSPGYVRSYWTDYDPSEAAALLFVVLFAIVALAQIVQSSLRRSWWMWPLILGTVGEVGGYAARYISIRNPTAKKPWLAQLLIVILAPNFLAATDYIIMARLMLHVAPQLAPFNPKWIGWIFVSSDILALVLQAAGGGALGGAETQKELDKAKALLLSGLAFQLVAFSLFVVLIIVFWARLKRKNVRTRGERWIFIMAAILVSAAMILIRSIFRFIEFAKTSLGGRGTEAFVKSEAIIYVFETVPIFIAALALVVVHPSWFGLPNDKSVTLEEKREMAVVNSDASSTGAVSL